MSMIAKNRLKSTWTPLGNEDTNNKIFEERRILVGKWFDKWTNDQKKKVLEDLLYSAKPKQLVFAKHILEQRVTTSHTDFTRVLPRVISIYMFSFLDPRSLCRCSQVCWYWRYLAELDQLWMPKCLRLGWFLPFTPSPFESGVWKRNYIEHIKSLRVFTPRDSPQLDLEALRLNHNEKRPPKTPKSKKTTPWKGSDPNPTDTWRYNVLENNDIIESINRLRRKKYYGSEIEEISRNAKSKIKAGQDGINQMRRSQSLNRIKTLATSPTSDERPFWAQQTSEKPYISRDAGLENGVGASTKRPDPVTPAPKVVSNPLTARSARDPPSTELFPSKPWEIPAAADSDDEH